MAPSRRNFSIPSPEFQIKKPKKVMPRTRQTYNPSSRIDGHKRERREDLRVSEAEDNHTKGQCFAAKVHIIFGANLPQ